jgi:hypothetical protein
MHLTALKLRRQKKKLPTIELIFTAVLRPS